MMCWKSLYGARTKVLTTWRTKSSCWANKEHGGVKPEKGLSPSLHKQTLSCSEGLPDAPFLPQYLCLH